MPVAARTLVKSPPELWSEISDPDALARHLGAFGEIRITHLEPESTVAWEGTRARGTVDLESAGWGTKVTVKAEELEGELPADSTSHRTTAPAEALGTPEPVHPTPATEPGGDAGSDVAGSDPSLPPQRGVRGLLSRFFGRREEVVEEAVPAPVVPDEQPTVEVAAIAVPEVEPAVEDRRDAAEVLDDMLASLGSARHRPFSRG